MQFSEPVQGGKQDVNVYILSPHGTNGNLGGWQFRTGKLQEESGQNVPMYHAAFLIRLTWDCAKVMTECLMCMVANGRLAENVTCTTLSFHCACLFKLDMGDPSRKCTNNSQ